MKTFLKRHLLWAGLLAVLAPLSVMLFLQYRWLVELESKSAIAHEATLSNYLEAVATEVEYFYRNSGGDLLNIPPTPFIENRLEKVAPYFERKSLKGVRRLFVLSFVKEDWGRLLFYDPLLSSMEPPSDLGAARAAYVAAAALQMLSKRDAVVSMVSLSVDERDPDNRIILYPIVDEESRIVGATGMSIDEEFFARTLLPMIIKKSMPAFFSEAYQEDLVITVRDGNGLLVIGSALEGESGEEVSRSLTFVFTDHRIALTSGEMNPQEWAGMSFRINMGLSILVAIVLLGGVVLALRTASREMRLSQMKSDFVSNVSHELRTPLASIRVFAEFLRLGRVNSPEKSREYGEYIETETGRLTGLLNNILDFARIESGRKMYRFQASDVEQIVADTLKTFEIRLRHNGFRMTLESPHGPLPPVVLDPDAITQAVGNLLDNAVKYSGGSRGISVTIARSGRWIVISIKDRGIGISRDEQKKIFERFHRVGTGLVHDVKGSGLGLSIVSHIVQAHGGSVTVESDPGKGSTFSIRLPVGAEGADA